MLKNLGLHPLYVKNLPCPLMETWPSGLRRGGANSEWRKPPQVRILPSPLHFKKN